MDNARKVVVNGNSMYPHFHNGEIVTAGPVEPDDIKVGDIIVYRKFEDHITIHRVVDVHRLGDKRICFETKGDNNPSKDEYIVHPHQVIGRVNLNEAEKYAHERQLIILLTRVTFDEKTKNAVKELVKKEMIDWDYVMAASSSNKVCTLVFSNLLNIVPDVDLPKDILLNYKCMKIKLRTHNEYIFEEYRKVRSELVRSGVRTFSLKGAWLIENIYKDKGIRSINDIDCLFPREMEADLIEAMGNVGYIQGQYDSLNQRVEGFSREKQIAWKRKMNNLMPFQKTTPIKSLPTVIFDFSFALDLSKDESAVKEMINNADGEYLRKAHFFVHLCAHLYKEATNAIWILETTDLNLIKFCDVREYIMQMGRDDINEAVLFAQKYGFSKAVYYTCHYLQEIYNEDYSEILKQFKLEDYSFLNQYGEADFGENSYWKKDFLDRLFAANNMDELENQQDFVNNYRSFLKM